MVFTCERHSCVLTFLFFDECSVQTFQVWPFPGPDSSPSPRRIAWKNELEAAATPKSNIAVTLSTRDNRILGGKLWARNQSKQMIEIRPWAMIQTNNIRMTVAMCEGTPPGAKLHLTLTKASSDIPFIAHTKPTQYLFEKRSLANYWIQHNVEDSFISKYVALLMGEPMKA